MSLIILLLGIPTLSSIRKTSFFYLNHRTTKGVHDDDDNCSAHFGGFMKQSFMCVLSGFFGCIFAVACGVVDCVGNKNAFANDATGFTIHVAEGGCEDNDANFLPESMEHFSTRRNPVTGS